MFFVYTGFLGLSHHKDWVVAKVLCVDLESLANCPLLQYCSTSAGFVTGRILDVLVLTALCELFCSLKQMTEIK